MAMDDGSVACTGTCLPLPNADTLVSTVRDGVRNCIIGTNTTGGGAPGRRGGTGPKQATQW